VKSKWSSDNAQHPTLTNRAVQRHRVVREPMAAQQRPLL